MSIFGFIEKAEKSLEDANQSIGVMKTKFADVLRYFGEDPEMTPMAFFTTLVSFVKVSVDTIVPCSWHGLGWQS